MRRVASLCEAHHLDRDPGCVYSVRSQAEALLDLGKVEAAAEMAERSVALHLALYGGEHPEYAIALVVRADVELHRDAFPAALSTLDQATAIFHARGQDQTLNMASVLRIKAAALHALKRDDEALAAITSAQAISESLAAKDQSRRFALLALRAQVLGALHRDAEARDAARAALALSPSGLAPERKQALEALAR